MHSLNVEISKDDIKLYNEVVLEKRKDIYEQVKPIDVYLMLEFIEFLIEKKTFGRLGGMSTDNECIYYDFSKTTIVFRHDSITDKNEEVKNIK
jgi:hypothetical protein